MANPIQPPDDQRALNRVFLDAGKRTMLRLDTAVEGVHFDPSILSPAEIGHRALAMALSDVAAIGADPKFAHVSIGARQETTEPFLFELEAGIGKLAKRLKVQVQRGGVFPSPTALTIQVVVEAIRGKTDWSPDGAAEGDVLFVTGGLGGALGAMTCLKRLGRHTLRGHEAVLQPHTRPEPHTATARWLRSIEAKVKPSAVLDVQDGLATELVRLALASRVGAVIDVSKLPVRESTKEAAGLVRGATDVWAVYGPEDYELLLAIPAKKRDTFLKLAKGREFTEIGTLVPKKERVTVINRENERVRLEPRLWHHFVRRAGIRAAD